MSKNVCFFGFYGKGINEVYISFGKVPVDLYILWSIHLYEAERGEGEP